MEEEKVVPQNANEHCPGIDSKEAGKKSACEGCPNQGMCESGEGKNLIKSFPAIQARMKLIKHKVLVLSGKGGVGKSTVSTQLAFYLASQGNNVGLLDLDLCGPSVPKMMGLTGQEVHQSNEGWSPVWIEDNLAVMSIGFILGDENAAVIWRGPRKDKLIEHFLADVDWGELDYLVIDSISLVKASSPWHIRRTHLSHPIPRMLARERRSHHSDNSPRSSLSRCPKGDKFLSKDKHQNFWSCRKHEWLHLPSLLKGIHPVSAHYWWSLEIVC